MLICAVLFSLSSIGYLVHFLLQASETAGNSPRAPNQTEHHITWMRNLQCFMHCYSLRRTFVLADYAILGAGVVFN